jgi:AraC-like DNA-binding protein
MSRRLLKHSFSLLHVDYVKLNNKWNFTNIISPYYRLYYIDKGEGHVYNSENKILLEEGYLYIIPSFTLCNLSCNNYLSQYFIQFFEDSPDGISLFTNNRKFAKIKANNLDIENFKRLLNLNPGRGINRSDNPKVYEKNNYYREYQELNKLQNISHYMETQGILLQLISRFLTPETYKQKNISAIPSKILDAISYIQVNLNKHITVAHLAERANQNIDYFSRVFHQYTGERPIKYINDKRIERAQYLITTTNKSYLDIAEETGFENLPYFSRIFKKVTGMTPGIYKKQNQFFNMI